MAVTFITRNLKDCLMNELILLRHLIMELLHTYYYDTNKIRNQDQGTFLHGGIVNIYIVYEITDNFNVSSYPTHENCLFGSAKLTKNTDIAKYWYSGYGIWFDRQGSFSFGNGVGKNVIIFGVDMSSSTKIDNRKKGVLILGKGPTQGL